MMHFSLFFYLFVICLVRYWYDWLTNDPCHIRTAFHEGPFTLWAVACSVLTSTNAGVSAAIELTECNDAVYTTIVYAGSCAVWTTYVIAFNEFDKAQIAREQELLPWNLAFTVDTRASVRVLRVQAPVHADTMRSVNGR